MKELSEVDFSISPISFMLLLNIEKLKKITT